MPVSLRSSLVAGWFALAGLVFSIAPALALVPDEIFIVANQNVPDSQAVAEHYCQQRGVPGDHVVALDLPGGEDIPRREFDEKLAGPLRFALLQHRERVKVLLTVYGVPLRVGPQELTADEQAAVAELTMKTAELQAELEKTQTETAALEEEQKKEVTDERGKDIEDHRRRIQELQTQKRMMEGRRAAISHAESQAAVDSELALLWWGPYELGRWQANPLYFRVPDETRQKSPPVLMVSRLDGPSTDVAKRLVDQAVEVERKGLEGKVYVDARGIGYNPAEGGHGYGGYDESMREMARLLKEAGGMDVTLDDRGELFASGACADCALYCGWYSLANYVDSCRFVPGAVAWHLASSEAVSLRDPQCKYWCKNLLEAGAAATLGPVAEPYTVGFPKPAEFFGMLATGQFTLVECYYRTLLFNSWMTVLVGDPLYNPFAQSPKLKAERVQPSPAAPGGTQ